MTRRTDETDNIYGDLIVSGPLPPKHGKAMWDCYCQACGGRRAVSGINLRNGSITHCGCKVDREAPTSTSLQKQLNAALDDIAQLKVRLAQLESRPAPTQPAPAPKKGLQGYTLANPTGHVAGRKWQPPGTPEEALKRASQLAALPFSERGKQEGQTLKDLQAELEACVLVIARRLNDDVDADPGLTLTEAYRDRMRHLSALQAAQKNYAFETSGQDYGSWFKP